ncbi:hypothetical protein FAGKG844_260019 [Frankia sp. AgKG'84/4]
MDPLPAMPAILSTAGDTERVAARRTGTLRSTTEIEGEEAQH